MAATDWLGSLFNFGGSLGDVGSGLLGNNTGAEVTTTAVPGFDNASLTAAQDDISSYNFATDPNPSMPTVNNPYSLGTSNPATNQGQAGNIMGMNVSDAVKIGASLYNDYENRKLQKAIANTNIKTKQNARERADTIQKQMTGGTGLTSGSDYKEIS